MTDEGIWHRDAPDLGGATYEDPHLGSRMDLPEARFLQKPQLQSATIGLFDRYQEVLFGPQAWGFVTMGLDLRPMSCPSLAQVLGFDFAIRKKVALLMNSGIDIKAALGYATADPDPVYSVRGCGHQHRRV